jgi:hypothetical protein
MWVATTRLEDDGPSEQNRKRRPIVSASMPMGQQICPIFRANLPV